MLKVLSIVYGLLIITSSAFAGKLKSNREIVVVNNVIVHGKIVHIGGWSALPATPSVAVKFDKLSTNSVYECSVLFYEGNTGWGKGMDGKISRVQMVYKIDNCIRQTRK